MVGLGRVELPTSPLSGVRSNQLSYRPNARSELAAPPPVLMSPGGSPKSHSLLKVFEDKVEHATSSYATRDYRKNFGQEKKACIELPNRPSGNGTSG